MKSNDNLKNFHYIPPRDTNTKKEEESKKRICELFVNN